MLQYIMRFAFDLTQIPIGKTGVGIYAVNLVKEIIRQNNEFELYFFVQDDDKQWKEIIPNTQNSNLILIKSSIFRKLIFRFFFEQILLPKKCTKLKIDALYSLHYTMPYMNSLNRIVMIPDMTFYLFPELHRKIKLLYFKSLIPISLKRSNHIITISESTKKDILHHFTAIEPEKISVIHLGVNPAITPPQANELLHQFGLEKKKYFLFIGTLEPRKNILGIIKAFHFVLNSKNDFIDEYKLVLVGKKGWFYQEIFTTIKNYRIENSVIFTGYVEEEVKQSLLTHAFLFVYPSFYEGFGLPILEAMSYGIPVITGNASSLPEVSGNAAIQINPYNWQEIADAMLQLLNDTKRYNELSNKSLVQAKQFSWQLTAMKTLTLFKTLIS